MKYAKFYVRKKYARKTAKYVLLLLFWYQKPDSNWVNEKLHCFAD